MAWYPSIEVSEDSMDSLFEITIPSDWFTELEIEMLAVSIAEYVEPSTAVIEEEIMVPSDKVIVSD